MTARTAYTDAHLVSTLAPLDAATAERIAFVYAQATGMNVEDRTAFLARVAAAVAENAAARPEPLRSYWIGLPVGINVYADGAVTYEVDLSEASDIAEGQPTDSDLVPLYPEAVVDADTETVSAAVDAGTITLATS